MKPPPGVVLRNGRYYRRQYLGMVDGKRKYKWHALTRVDDGLAALYACLSEIHKPAASMPARITQWAATLSLSAREQKEMERKARIVAQAFVEFDVSQVKARHVMEFLTNWTAQNKLRMALSYRAMLHAFFDWSVLQGDRQDNPVSAVKTKRPQPRSRYMTDAEFTSVRTHLDPMLQVYVDLLYLTGQRGKDVRGLRWSQVADDIIHFQPSKTMHSTAVKVEIPVTVELASVLSRAKGLMRDRSRVSPYVIHKPDGSAYTSHGLNSAWAIARAKAGVKEVTLRDIRAKHATDAERLGYGVGEISAGLAHADESMTRTYLKQRVARRGKVVLKLPE